jgi:2,5-diamino-6-(ribosylamino)-4(3H)-pyrimidinone 5'-phosphate reductase
MSRPRVVVHAVASVDGRMSLGPNRTGFEDVGDERWQAIWASDETGDQRLRRLECLHTPQVFVEGSASFLRESDDLAPLPPFESDSQSLYQDHLPEAIVQRPEHQGWFAVVDGRGRLRGGVTEFEGWPGWHVLHLVSYGVPAEYLAYLQHQGIPYLIAGQKHVDLRSMLERLTAKLGVECVVSTAGGRLNGALLRAGLVDEINIEFLPGVIGGLNTPSLFDSPDLRPGEWPARLKLLSAQVEAGGRVWLRYRVIRDQASMAAQRSRA